MFSYGITPIAQQKREIRRAANCIGAAYAFIFIFDWLLSYFAQNSYSFAYFIFTVANDEVYSELFQISFSLLSFLFPYLLALKLSGQSCAVLNFKKPAKGRALPLVLMGIGVCQIGELATSMFATAMDNLGSAPVYNDVTYGKSVYAVVLAVVSTAIVPALVEEFAIRGVAMGILRRFSDGFAIIVSAIIFGLMHGNLVQAPFAFIVGLGLGFVAIKGGSVWLAVLVHFINNLCAVGFTYLSEHLNSITKTAVYSAYAAFMLALGVIGFCLCKEKDEIFSFQKEEEICSFKTKILTFFTSPLMVGALVLTAIKILELQVA